jgi:hypothetical protein
MRGTTFDPDTEAVDEGLRITCSKCRTELHDPPEAVMAASGRPACPTCGANERNYTLTVQPGEGKFAGGSAHLRIRSQATGRAISDGAVRRLDELATGRAVRTITWHDPTEQGDVFCEVRDEIGNVLGVNVGSDLDDAILNLADQLKPPTED